jgi:hypothetical protein
VLQSVAQPRVGRLARHSIEGGIEGPSGRQSQASLQAFNSADPIDGQQESHKPTRQRAETLQQTLKLLGRRHLGPPGRELNRKTEVVTQVAGQFLS